MKNGKKIKKMTQSVDGHLPSKYVEDSVFGKKNRKFDLI